MTPNMYQALSCKTLSPSTSSLPRERQVEIFATKLLGETVELLEAYLTHQNLIDEMGDITWYLAMLCDAFGWQMSELAGSELEPLEREAIREAHTSPSACYTSILTFLHAAVIEAKNLCEHVVKRAAHGHTNPFHQEKIFRWLLCISSTMESVTACLEGNFSMEEVFIRNVEKLQRDRYPNGFSAEVSEARYIS